MVTISKDREELKRCKNVIGKRPGVTITCNQEMPCKRCGPGKMTDGGRIKSRAELMNEHKCYETEDEI